MQADESSPEEPTHAPETPEAEPSATEAPAAETSAQDASASDASSSETVPADEQTDGPVDAGDAADKDADASGQSVDESIDLSMLEALLFSTHHPLTAGRLAELLESSAKPIRQAVRALNQQYQETQRSFRIEQVAGGFQMLTLPAFASIIKKHQQKEADAKLTKAALETLAIIAYKQPILRADIESIRGVMCGETVRSLMEKHLVKIAGRADEPGRPILYGTTKRFLEVFGLNSLKDLPKGADELKPQKKTTPETATPDARETEAREPDAAAAQPADAQPADARPDDAEAVDVHSTESMESKESNSAETGAGDDAAAAEAPGDAE
ncbi:MAG: SMC-Scp complex subunit ScpB [Tepidisphaeraceae bacterium]